jgi:hypothetical protein
MRYEIKEKYNLQEIENKTSRKKTRTKLYIQNK